MEHTEHAQEKETGMGAPPALSDAIARLMAQPELLSMVASALGAPAPSASSAAPSETGNAAETETNTAESEASAEPPASEDSASVGSAASASASASLPDLISTLAPLLGGGKGLQAGGGGHRGKEDDRTCLLRALKPYVSPGRREAIDYMIRLSQISEALKRLS